MKTFMLAASIALALSASAAVAKDQPSATATFTGESVAVGVGYTWGKGVLTYKGHTYPFTAKGVSVLGAGAEKITGVAEVYHLDSLADFPGAYVAAAVGGSVAKAGGGTAVLTNAKGVVVRLHTKDKGLQLNIAATGLNVSLDKK